MPFLIPLSVSQHTTNQYLPALQVEFCFLKRFKCLAAAFLAVLCWETHLWALFHTQERSLKVWGHDDVTRRSAAIPARDEKQPTSSKNPPAPGRIAPNLVAEQQRGFK